MNSDTNEVIAQFLLPNFAILACVTHEIMTGSKKTDKINKIR